MPSLSRRAVLRSLAGSLGAGTVATVTAPAALAAPAHHAATAAQPPNSSASRPPYRVPGLVPGTDNTNAFTAAFSSAQPGDQLIVPPGDWTHSGTIALRSSGIMITGYGARLLATNPRYAGLHITGSAVTIMGLTHEVQGANARGNGENMDDCPFAIDQAADVVLQDVVSVGARDAGIFLYGAQRARLVNVLVRNSLADGVHMTNGSSACVVDSPTVLSPGDDALAVVSYTNDAAVCSDIRIVRPTVVNGQGRGVSVSGGANVTVTGVDIRRTRGSGVYLASEQGQFNTRPVTNCLVAGGTVDDANWDPSLDTGNIGVFQLVPGSVSSNIVVEGLTVTGSQKFGAPYVKVGTTNGAGGRLDGLVLGDLVLPQGQVYVDGLSPSAGADGKYTCVTLAGVASSDGVTTVKTGLAATGNGITLSRIRR